MNYHLVVETEQFANEENYMKLEIKLSQPLSPDQHKNLIVLSEQLYDICKPHIQETKHKQPMIVDLEENLEPAPPEKMLGGVPIGSEPIDPDDIPVPTFLRRRLRK